MVVGNCGYGDNCIYLHDRGDYKSGWQLEKEWEESRRKRRKFGEQEDFTIPEEKSDDDDDLPFACAICRGDFREPVMTRCGHYFCELCAMAHLKKSRNRCFICEENTQGILNSAPKLVAKLRQRANAPPPPT
eukprot:CAMPEP_0119153824 /NCGR_PEP_ID=MMETSP1310-20130426/49877_1 /TAXON_ID=464262 /ORGANISM="Genus nov. species nov., Strain RCC2339" /LENGTH=131 /DNA_ID=CAMNT_0007146305 /DNA_START=87 /DNA_END=479 /DNA_ORIENTATION=+